MSDDATDQPDDHPAGDDASPVDGAAAESGDVSASDGATDGDDDIMRDAAHELLRAARSFLDAAERTLNDDETMQRWTERGQDMVRGFLAGFAGDPADRRRPDDDDGIEHIPVD